MTFVKAEMTGKNPGHRVLKANWDKPYIVKSKVKDRFFELNDVEGRKMHKAYHLEICYLTLHDNDVILSYKLK